MDAFAEKKGLRSKINVLSVSINHRQERLKKVKRFSRLGIQERRALRHDKKEFSKALDRYKELAKGNQKVTDRYFDNQAEQRRAIQETYKGLNEKEAELFKKIEPSIKEEIEDPNNLHLKKLSQNQPKIQPNRSQETPEIQPAPQRSIKMPSM